MTALLTIAAAAFVVAVLVVWTTRVYGGAHTAWARGLYDGDDSATEHGYANAVRRLAGRKGRRS